MKEYLLILYYYTQQRRAAQYLSEQIN